MKMRVFSMVALIGACMSEPEEALEISTTAQGVEQESTQDKSPSTQRESSPERRTEATVPEFEVHALRPGLWSGHRLRSVYRAGQDGSVGRGGSMFWDAELGTHCKLNRVDRTLTGANAEIGETLYCYPFMGSKRRCEPSFRDPQCSQEVLVAKTDSEKIYQELYEFLPANPLREPCDDPPAGLYKVSKFEENALEMVYRRDRSGACVGRSLDKPVHTVELAGPVPQELLASGTIVIE